MKKIPTKQFLIALTIVVVFALIGAVLFASYKYDLRFPGDHKSSRSGVSSVQHARARRAAPGSNEFYFRDRLHKVHWTKPIKNTGAKKKYVPTKNSNKLQSDTKDKELLEDIFISVKTSSKFHESRLGVILKTWFKLAEKQVQTDKAKIPDQVVFVQNRIIPARPTLSQF